VSSFDYNPGVLEWNRLHCQIEIDETLLKRFEDLLRKRPDVIEWRFGHGYSAMASDTTGVSLHTYSRIKASRYWGPDGQAAETTGEGRYLAVCSWIDRHGSYGGSCMAKAKVEKTLHLILSETAPVPPHACVRPGQQMSLFGGLS
jgi:hypothetical protein